MYIENLILTFSSEAKEDMRKDYCKEETVTRVDTDSCDLDEISIAKEWT